MKSRLKKISKDTVIYGLGGILGRGLSFFLLPVYTRIFSTSTYGIIELFNILTVFVGLVISMGLDNGLNYFYFQNKKKDARSFASITILQWKLINSLIIISAAILFSQLFNELFFNGQFSNKYFIIAFITVFFQLIVQYILSIYRLSFRAWSFLVVSFLQSIFSASIGLYFIIVLDQGLYGYLLGNLIGSCITLPFIIKELSKYINFTRINLEWTKRIFAFSLPLLPVSLCTYFLYLSDRWFIHYYLSDHQLGLYSVAARFALIISFLIGTFGRSFMPHSMDILTNNNKLETNSLFEFTFRYFLGLSFIIIITLNFLAPYLVRLLTTEEFHSSFKIIGILSLSAVFFGGTYFSSLGTWKTEKTYLYTLSTFIALTCNILLNIILIPIIGNLGAALSTTFGMFVLLLFSFYFSHKQYKIYFNFKAAIFQFISLVAYFVLYFLLNLDNLSMIFIGLVSVVVIFSVTIRKQELAAIKNIVLK